MSALTKLRQLANIKKRQVLLPISKIRAMVTPLTVRDDLTLRSIVSSPDIYDRELSRLLYHHCELIDIEEEENRKLSFTEFCDRIADIDRKVLIWGLHEITYNEIGKQTIICDECGNEFTDTIKSEEVLHPDFVKFWDNE